MHFRTPFRICVSGSSFAGKTTFVCKLLTNRESLICGEPIKKIIWCCRNRDFFPPQLKGDNGIVIHEGLTSLADIEPHSLIVYDDLMLEIGNSKEVCELLTVNSSHRKISVIVLTQNLYHSATFAKTIQLNYSYNVIFKNYRDQNQIKTFLRQVEPCGWRSLWQKLYKEVFSRPHAYLIVDFTPATNDIFRFKTDIFNPEWFTVLAPPDHAKNSSQFDKIEEEYIYTASLDKV